MVDTWRAAVAIVSLAYGAAAQELACAGAALTGLHVYLDAAGVPVRARAQCEGEWERWAPLGGGRGGAPALQVGAHCPEGEAVVELALGAEDDDEPLLAECATPRAAHLRLVRRAAMRCGLCLLYTSPSPRD